MTGRAATRAVRTITEIARVITRIVRAAIRTVRVVSRIARSVTRTARAATRTVRMLTRGSHLRRIPRLRETIRTARLRAACRIPREFRRAQEPIRLVTRQETRVLRVIPRNRRPIFRISTAGSRQTEF